MQVNTPVADLIGISWGKTVEEGRGDKINDEGMG